MVSVIASSVRKGNVLEKDGKLYLVITAENIHPGKGTPVTHLEMRRIPDGLKTVERLRTTDSVEKAFVESQRFNYLYKDGEHHWVFMQPETFDQVHVSADIIGDTDAACGRAQQQRPAETATLECPIGCKASQSEHRHVVTREPFFRERRRTAIFDRRGTERVEAKNARGCVGRHGD